MRDNLESARQTQQATYLSVWKDFNVPYSSRKHGLAEW